MANQGIDYGLGRANIDRVTGIRYGVISQHTPNPDAIQDIYTNGDNLSYASAVADAKQSIGASLRQQFDNLGVLPYAEAEQPAYVDPIVDSVWETIEQDFNDRYEESDDTYRYASDGYIIETSSLGLFVTKSPYFTYAAFCSPCCPGAGDLDSPIIVDTAFPDNTGLLHVAAQLQGLARVYCLGPDWFDADSPMPYHCYRVDTGDAVTE